MLTTPATASAPYSADPPSVRTSIRSVMTSGIEFMSTNSPPTLVLEPAGAIRLPLMSVSVEFSPKFLRLTLAVPSTWLYSPGFSPATIALVIEPELISRFLITSQIIAAPCASILSRSITWTGEGASRGVPRI